MTFAVPLFLFAAMAGIVPVVLHLINRQRAKELPFSTLRFLRVAVQKTRRRRRIQDLFLMLLRVAVLLLIAMGLSRPTLTSLKSLFGGGARSATAVILDNSASMGTIDQGKPRFETARGATEQILNEQGDGDQAGLWITGGPKLAEELGKLQRNQEKISQALASANVSYVGADLAARLKDARRQLAESDAPNKAIFIVTDQQVVSWAGLKEEEEWQKKTQNLKDDQIPELERKMRDIPVIVVDCNRAPKPNVAVTDVNVEAAVPVAGLPVHAAVELRNTSTLPQTRHLELHVDGAKEASSPDIKIPQDGTANYDFSFAFKRGGLHRGEVRLVGDDGSKLDDRRFFSMEVNQGIPVAVVKQEKHEIAYLDDTYYVERALSPAKAGGWAITAKPRTLTELEGDQLSAYTAIYLVNVKAPDADLASRLRTYVEQGGNLFWICGDNVQAEEYNRMNEQAGKALLPAPILEIRTPDAAAGKDSWSCKFLDKRNPALRSFLQPPSLYQSILVYKNARLDKGAPGLSVLARLDDDEPLLAERTVAQGRVLMLTTSGHVGWTNLPLRPIFLPMLAQLTFQLAGVEQTRHVGLAGSPLVVPFDPKNLPTVVEVHPPSGVTIRPELVDKDKVRLKELRYAETHDIGIYTVSLMGGTKNVQLAYSVNVDPGESNPAKVTPEEMKKAFLKTPLIFADNPEDLSGVFKQLREGRSLWGLFLTLVLVGLVFETFISNMFTPKQEENLPEYVPPGMRRLAKKGKTAA